MSAAKLEDLPPELLAQVVEQITSARSLRNLSLTCRSIHRFVDKDGYRIFVKSRFPSFAINIPSDCQNSPQCFIRTASPSLNPEKAAAFWKDAARATTTLSRNWDRRAFVAHVIREPSVKTDSTAVDHARRRRHRGQSMGFIPVIDCYEVWHGGDWSSRKEVLAWGAGARLCMRTRLTGSVSDHDISDDSDQRPQSKGGPQYRWRSHLMKGAVEGKDDVTTLKLLPHLQDRPERALVGRANGFLELVSLAEDSTPNQLSVYDTGGKSVRSATIDQGTGRFFAACLSDHIVALYPAPLSIPHPSHTVVNDAQISIQKQGKNARTWTCSFLDQHRLAIGLGPSTEPIHIHDLNQRRHDTSHARTLSLATDSSDKKIDVPGSSSAGTSIYSIASLPQSSASLSAEGDLFLSGAYDAIARLHDLRLSSTVVSSFLDPVDASSPIYSLLPIGRERFVAGGALHSLIKVFDLRMPGEKVYYASDLDPCIPNRRSRGSDLNSQTRCRSPACCMFHHDSRHSRRDWNVFLGTRSHGNDQSIESPVYSLSRPSSSSPIFYAGVENRIIQIDMVSVLDRHHDPLYGFAPEPDAALTVDSAADYRYLDAVAEKWDPHGDVMSLPMYEHNTGPVTLRHQQPVRHIIGQNFVGLDERWSAASIRESHA